MICDFLQSFRTSERFPMLQIVFWFVVHKP